MSEFIKKVIANMEIVPTGQKRVVPVKRDAKSMFEIGNTLSSDVTKTEEVFRLQTRFEQLYVVPSCVKSAANYSTAKAAKENMLKQLVYEVYGEYLTKLYSVESLLYMHEIDEAAKQIQEIARDMMGIE